MVTWSDLVRPPRLQDSETDAGQQRTATWLELFFDLAFVVVVGELTAGSGSGSPAPREKRSRAG